jgi:hypothetical protein
MRAQYVRFPLAAVLLLAACGGKSRSYYVRVVEPDGRAYYTHTSNALYSEAGGFVTFRDLVTREDVRLANGKYAAEPVGEGEVEAAQSKYIADPRRKPEAEYHPDKVGDASVWD